VPGSTTMKKMLVTGANGDIGKAIVTEFKNDCDLITVDRIGEVTYRGDLADRKFLDKLVSTLDIDILINNAGILDNDFFKVMDVNFMAAGYLTLEFYKKMSSGHIINVTSYRANQPAWSDITYDRLNYNCSKAALKTFSMALKYVKKRNVRITSLEPSWVNTHLPGGPVNVPEEQYRKQTLQRIPMKPEYIAGTIRWILSQPQELYISALEIENFILIDCDVPGTGREERKDP